MAGKKFYVSPETFADFLLGRDVNTCSINLKGVDHPIFKEAAGIFLGVDDEQSCKAIHTYWTRRKEEIVKILIHGTNVERKKEARLRYFLEMTGLKLIKREEILRGSAKDSGVSDAVSGDKVEISGGDSESEVKVANTRVSASKCSFAVSSTCTSAVTLPQAVAMEIEVPQSDVERLVTSQNETSSSNYDSEGDKEEDPIQSYQWKKEGEFTLTPVEWRDICDTGLKLSRKWTSLISQKFFTVNTACVIQFQGYHFNKQRRPDTPFLMIRGYCAHVSCKRFRLTMQSTPIANEDSLVSVWGRGTEKHGDKKKTRQLKGWDRLRAKKVLSTEKAHLYREEKLREADRSALLKGNLQGIKSMSVLRRARSEALREETLD